MQTIKEKYKLLRYSTILLLESMENVKEVNEWIQYEEDNRYKYESQPLARYDKFKYQVTNKFRRLETDMFSKYKLKDYVYFNNELKNIIENKNNPYLNLLEVAYEIKL